eukprot:4471552-Amphidinium_carterae.1
MLSLGAGLEAAFMEYVSEDDAVSESNCACVKPVCALDIGMTESDICNVSLEMQSKMCCVRVGSQWYVGPTPVDDDG